MLWPRFRPRFTMPLPVPPQAFVARVREGVQEPGTAVTGIVLPKQIELRVPEEQQRLFTPVLHVHVVEEAGGGHHLAARFAPHPHIWMLVIAIYFGLGCAAIGGVMWGASQLILGGPLWAFAALPASLVLGGFIHGAVLIGQGLSADQMHVLRSFLEHALEDTTKALATEG